LMQQASLQIQHPCHLSVLFDEKVLVVAYSKRPRPIAVMIEEGNLHQTSTTASGKVLLSCLEEADRDHILRNDAPYQQLSKTQKTQFARELSQRKNQGNSQMPTDSAPG